MPGITPFQTVGPFLHLGLHASQPQPDAQAVGGQLRVSGRLLDGQGAGVPDGVLEFWWADSTGQYGGNSGFARVFTGPHGEFALGAGMPGRVEGPSGEMQAPHLAVLVLGRGILTRLVTRVYFVGDTSLDRDPILQLVPRDRRATLLARFAGERQYEFDIVLQGEHETVFFDV